MKPLTVTLILGAISFVIGCSRLRPWEKKSAQSAQGATDGTAQVVAQALGNKALSAQQPALDELYSLTTDHAPASIRPDPDVYVRRLLRQFRSEGTVMAREIGRVEEYRMMLGGASEDFRVSPQETYDATALLSHMKVAEEICQGLVNPSSWQHPGWSTILPAPAQEKETNLRFLAARIWGVPDSKVTSEILSSLSQIITNASTSGTTGSSLTYQSYVPACVAICLDAEALLL